MHSSSRTTSDETYTLTAVPNLRPEAEMASRIESLIFVATDGYDSHTWTVINEGRFVVDFSFLVDAGTAHRIFQRLCQGETVMFPSLFSLGLLKSCLREGRERDR